MTVLTHTRGPFERARSTSGSRGSVGADGAAANLSTIKRFCMGAATILVAGAAIAAIMALKMQSIFRA